MHGRISPNLYAQNVAIERETDSVRREPPDDEGGK